MKKIYQHYKSTYKISDQDWEIFSSKLIQEDFPKKTALIKAGKTEKYLSFLDEGIVRFYVPKEENDLTFSFVFSDAFVCAYDSFLTQTPSTYTIEAITKVKLWRLAYEDLEAIYATAQIGNLIGRKAAEELFLLKAKRELSLLNQSAEERYLDLFETRPELIKFIPLKYIATYIGVTPQALSRIRKRIR